MINREAKITPNFKWKEFIRKQDQDPPEEVQQNITNLANRLQAIRDFVNAPITITSAYRTRSHNQRVGGAPKSSHITGKAADIIVDGIHPHLVQELLVNWSGGLGRYDGHTHIDIRDAKHRWDNREQT